MLDFYPRPPCGGRLEVIEHRVVILGISIHVPRVGDDAGRAGRKIGRGGFLSTSPVWGTTFQSHASMGSRVIFLSTSPVWGTTASYCSSIDCSAFLSTSPVWGTTAFGSLPRRLPTHFYPRPPCGGRPSVQSANVYSLAISIHVPRVGDDRVYREYGADRVNFYPRPPCGGRLEFAGGVRNGVVFLSTSPVWGTTSRLEFTLSYRLKFLSTSPVWGTTHVYCTNTSGPAISIHVPRVGDDIRRWTAWDS